MHHDTLVLPDEDVRRETRSKTTALFEARSLGKVCTPLEGSGVRLQCGAALGGLRMPKERKPKEPQLMLEVQPWQSFVEVGGDVALEDVGFRIST